jgi:hypothetical protein
MLVENRYEFYSNLDRMMAEDVMGWVWNNDKSWYVDSDGHAHYDFYSSNGSYYSYVPFSEELSAAWLLIDKLKNLPDPSSDEYMKSYTVNFVLEYRYSGLWCAYWQRTGFFAQHENPAMAICLALKKYVERHK